MISNIDDVKIGDWAYICCEQDLMKIFTEEDLQYVRDNFYDNDMPAKVFETKNEALKSLGCSEDG